MQCEIYKIWIDWFLKDFFNRILIFTPKDQTKIKKHSKILGLRGCKTNN